MAYTIKQVAKLAGVTPRLLRWYDEIGLLRPAYYGDNGYRYYEQEQLLLLQQILFFKELGLPLSEVKKLLASNEFNKLQALHAHKQLLTQRINRMHELIGTIDKTITHMKGIHTMKDNELYIGFDQKQQAEYEQYLVDRYGTMTKDRIAESKKRVKKWTKDDWQRIKDEGHEIYQGLVACIEQGMLPESDQVQALIAKHCHMIGRFYDVSKEVYIGLAQLYCDHPDFRKFFDPYHQKLAEYMDAAMQYYARYKLI